MTTVFESMIASAYAKSGALYLGLEAVRTGGMVPGPITVLVEANPTLSFTGHLNAGHGLARLRPLHAALGLMPGHVVNFVVRSSNTIVIVYAGAAALAPALAGDATVSARRDRRMRYRPLGPAHKQFIAAEICRLGAFARDARNPSRRTARFLIDSLLWCWTADGIDAAGHTGRDKLKYDCDHQLHTRDAKRIWFANGRRGSGLRHEHAVPRNEIIHCLLERPRTEAETLELLERLCFAVIVTKAEDKKFTGALRDTMPRPWSCAAHGEERFARYAAVGLRGEIVEP